MGEQTAAIIVREEIHRMGEQTAATIVREIHRMGEQTAATIGERQRSTARGSRQLPPW
jgi:hypothetical protein